MIDRPREAGKHGRHATRGPASLTPRFITTRAELATYASRWNDLLGVAAADSIFLTWEWASAWLDAVHPEARLFVIVVENERGELAAVAPFYRTTLRVLGRIRYECLRIIGDCQSGGEYQDIVVRTECLEESLRLIGETLRARRDWDVIWLPYVADWTGAGRRLEILATLSGLLSAHHPRQFSQVSLPASYEQYLGSLGSKFRYNIRRYGRLLESEAPVECVRFEGGEDLSLWLDALFELHARRWRSVGQEGAFVRRPAMVEFYRRIAPVAFARGWLRLHALTVGGRRVAMRYGYAYGDVFYGLQSGFDPAVNGGAHVLMAHILERSIAERLTVYDFLGGADGYKKEWNAQVKTGRSMLLGNPSVKTRLLFRSGAWPTGRFIRHGRPANPC